MPLLPQDKLKASYIEKAKAHIEEAKTGFPEKDEFRLGDMLYRAHFSFQQILEDEVKKHLAENPHFKELTPYSFIFAIIIDYYLKESPFVVEECLSILKKNNFQARSYIEHIKSDIPNRVSQFVEKFYIAHGQPIKNKIAAYNKLWDTIFKNEYLTVINIITYQNINQQRDNILKFAYENYLTLDLNLVTSDWKIKEGDELHWQYVDFARKEIKKHISSYCKNIYFKDVNPRIKETKLKQLSDHLDIAVPADKPKIKKKSSNVDSKKHKIIIQWKKRNLEVKPVSDMQSDLKEIFGPSKLANELGQDTQSVLFPTEEAEREINLKTLKQEIIIGSWVGKFLEDSLSAEFKKHLIRFIVQEIIRYYNINQVALMAISHMRSENDFFYSSGSAEYLAADIKNFMKENQERFIEQTTLFLGLSLNKNPVFKQSLNLEDKKISERFLKEYAEQKKAILSSIDKIIKNSVYRKEAEIPEIHSKIIEYLFENLDRQKILNFYKNTLHFKIEITTALKNFFNSKEGKDTFILYKSILEERKKKIKDYIEKSDNFYFVNKEEIEKKCICDIDKWDYYQKNYSNAIESFVQASYESLEKKTIVSLIDEIDTSRGFKEKVKSKVKEWCSSERKAQDSVKLSDYVEKACEEQLRNEIRADLYGYWKDLYSEWENDFSISMKDSNLTGPINLWMRYYESKISAREKVPTFANGHFGLPLPGETSNTKLDKLILKFEALAKIIVALEQQFPAYTAGKSENSQARLAKFSAVAKKNAPLISTHRGKWLGLLTKLFGTAVANWIKPSRGKKFIDKFNQRLSSINNITTQNNSITPTNLPNSKVQRSDSSASNFSIQAGVNKTIDLAPPLSSVAPAPPMLVAPISLSAQDNLMQPQFAMNSNPLASSLSFSSKGHPPAVKDRKHYSAVLHRGFSN